MSDSTVSHGMLEELGRVVSCYDGGVWVEVQRQAACGSCSVRHGCGSAQLLRFSRTPPLRFAIATSQQLQLGDQVRLGLKAADLARASLLAYGVPLLLALAGAAAGQMWLGGDAWAGLAFMVGLGIGGLWLRRHHQHQSSRYLPRLLGVVCRVENFSAVAEPFSLHRV
ncbi:MAG: SoxR reducing system RseC family protein [Halomonas sp.]|uniref:SoxR reducing system RseC family protein n=1 Tax=Halomonas sp. TaxID=1486246 RepID=UPI003F8E5D51